VPDCCPAVPDSNSASPQPTADCQSSSGLPPKMAFGFRLTSVRGDRVEDIKEKHLKKNFLSFFIVLQQKGFYIISFGGLIQLGAESMKMLVHCENSKMEQ
jgi:hypothetical protein